MRYTYFRKPQPEFTMCPSWLSSSGVVGWLNDWIYLVLLSGVKLDQLPLFSGHRGTSKHHFFFKCPSQLYWVDGTPAILILGTFVDLL